MQKILLVEDSEDIRNLVVHSLKDEFDVWPAANCEKALQLLKHGKPDLIVMDIMLPDGDGFHLFSHMKQKEGWSKIPTIFLTAKEEIENKIMAFSLGAEDYMVKPFHPTELKLRVTTRLSKKEKVHDVLQVGPFKIDYRKQRVYTLSADELNELELTPIEFRIFTFFIENESCTFSRSQILDAVWGQSFHAIDRTVDRHISGLRKKLGELGDVLQSVYGQGYQFKIPSQF